MPPASTELLAVVAYGRIGELAALCVNDGYHAFRTSKPGDIDKAKTRFAAFEKELGIAGDGVVSTLPGEPLTQRAEATLEAVARTGLQLAALADERQRPAQAILGAAGFDELDRMELEVYAVAAHLADVLQGSSEPDARFAAERLANVRRLYLQISEACIAAASREPARVGLTLRALKAARLLEQAAVESSRLLG